jgi:hypothetical protein
MEHDWLEWWDGIGQSCEATPYVADGLKVTGWLDGVAEMAMGFLPCGGAVVLIKRYWMGQEVGWLEWSDAVLSCIPYLGKVGSLALRGVAGAAKWFLRARKLGHLSQGRRWIEEARQLWRRLGCWLTRNACFVAGTLVWVLPSGANPKETPPSKAIAKPIEAVREGEWVLTREEGTGKVGWAPVLKVHKRWAAESELVVIKSGREKLKVTKEHPFYVVGQGWKGAGELKVGEKLVGAEGNLVAVEGIEPFKIRGPPYSEKQVAVYNLTVFGTQTYFVSKEKIWVHNTCLQERLVRHHIFPRAFRETFEARGINIDAYLYLLPCSVHYSIHGYRGGVWNARWREFLERENPLNPYSRSQLADYALRLIDEFNLRQYAGLSDGMVNNAETLLRLEEMAGRR